MRVCRISHESLEARYAVLSGAKVFPLPADYNFENIDIPNEENALALDARERGSGKTHDDPAWIREIAPDAIDRRLDLERLLEPESHANLVAVCHANVACSARMLKRAMMAGANGIMNTAIGITKRRLIG